MFDKAHFKHISAPSPINFFGILFLSIALFILFPSFAHASGEVSDRIRNVTGKNCSDPQDLADCMIADGPCNKDISALDSAPCYSSDYDPSTQSCNVGDIYFNPFGNDITWDLGNAHCLSYILTTGAMLTGAFFACDTICFSAPTSLQSMMSQLGNNLPKAPVPKQSIASRILEGSTRVGNAGATYASNVATSMTIIDPMMIGKIALYTARCANILSVADSASCCIAAASCSAAYATSIAVLGGIFETSKNAFHNTRICGDGTNIWVRTTDTNNKWSKDSNNYFKCLRKIFYQPSDPTIDRPSDCNINKPTQRLCALVPKESRCDFTVGDSEKTVSNQFFREYIYGGIEYEDNGDGACDNPKDPEWSSIIGYYGGKQRYYFRGSTEEPQFACSRFLEKGMQDQEGYKAYKCCKKRAKDTICIERKSGDKYQFCSTTGGECWFKSQDINPPVRYQIFEAFTDSRYLCAQTYSVCPYNHFLGGGTELIERDSLTSVKSNFCQYLRHCIKKPPTSDLPRANFGNSFFSDACIDKRGDSQFITRLANITSPIPLKSKNFSAPIVQCLKESLENNFFQIAGRNICPNANDIIVNGKCKDPNNNIKDFSIVKGQKMGDTIFSKIQGQFKFFIKLAMILSVAMFGYQVLLATPDSFINKKTILLYLVKFGLVTFFALGTTWHSLFLNQILKISTDLSEMTFFPSSKNDGCYFPKYNGDNLSRLRNKADAQKTQTDTNKIYAYESFVEDEKARKSAGKPGFYPEGKSYLRIWDTIDCKIARALGYGPDVNSENFTKMIFAGFLTGPLGITFFFAAFAYGFLLISIVLRAIHITIMSLIGVILLIFVSPLTITCVLFERTKGIFENWYKQLMGFILQPMILFAYLGVLLTVFDNVFLGDAKFNDAKDFDLPTINCSDYGPSNSIKPSETSIYCIFQFQKFKKYTGLEVFDLAIPVLMDLNKNKINSVIKAAVILFVFYQFLDKITLLAQKLVGGSELKPESMPDIAGKMEKFAKGVQKRALNATTRFATKHSKSLAGKGAKRVTDNFGTKNGNIPGSNRPKDSVGTASDKNESVPSDSAGTSNNENNSSNPSNSGANSGGNENN